jgi:hypothetical protein
MSTAKRRFLVGFVGYVLNLAAAAVLIDAGFTMQGRFAWTVLGFLASAGFCVVYHVRTGGTWATSVHGAHLMTFSASMAGILALIVVNQLGVIPVWLVPYLAAGIYITVAWLFLWRLDILTLDQRRPRKKAGDSL